MMEITFFPNGCNMAFEEGEQIPVAQKPWILVFAEYLDKNGIDPTKQIFELPDGRQAKIIKFDDDGKTAYNWEAY